MIAAENVPSPAVAPRLFRDTVGSFPTGVTVMTTAHEGVMAGVTISSFNTLSLEPPLILWSLSTKAPSLELFRHARRFVVNILSEGQQDIARQFARGSEDKFRGVDLANLECGMPAISGAAAHMECELRDVLPGGDHEILVGHVSQAWHHALPPMVFHRGRFGSFQEAS